MDDLRQRNWLSAQDFRQVQSWVPICCVDVMPVRLDTAGAIAAVGMIWRDVPAAGKRWCLVGGRLWRNESFAEAATRQIRETLGDAVQFAIPPDAQPVYVAQYFLQDRGLGTVDVRQHAVACTLVVALTGEVTAAGEAEAFRWFSPHELPGRDHCGFGQEIVVQECLRRTLSAAAPRRPV